jgi:hypothetical protein
VEKKKDRNAHIQNMESCMPSDAKGDIENGSWYGKFRRYHFAELNAVSVPNTTSSCPVMSEEGHEATPRRQNWAHMAHPYESLFDRPWG